MFSKMPRLLPLTRRVQYVAVEKTRKESTSTLYLSGERASQNYQVLIPHIDFYQRFQDMDTLHRNVTERGMNIDVKALKETWDMFESAKKEKTALYVKKKWMDERFRTLTANTNKTALEKLRAQGREFREVMKTVKRKVLELEQKAVIGGLALPNVIHPDTPVTNEEKIIYEFRSKPTHVQDQTHLQIADKLNLVEFYDSSYYFLKNDAATFELSISYHVLDKCREKGFLQMSNYDFGTTVALEGIGLDPNDASSVFVLNKVTADDVHRLHLVGGASLASFCSFHAKTITSALVLPQRYVTMGRHYSPRNDSLSGLFSTWQSSAVEAFVTTASHEQAMNEFQATLDMLVSIYSSLGYHFRVEYLPVRNLRPWESLRASFQMFSANLQTYIEVGNVSLCDDYISKRLLICCVESRDTPREFVHVVSSTVISIPHVLGCMLECDGEKFSLPVF